MSSTTTADLGEELVREPRAMSSTTTAALGEGIQ